MSATITPAALTALIEAKVADAKPFVSVWPLAGARGLSSSNAVASLVTSALAEISKLTPLKKIETFTGAAKAIYQVEGVTTYLTKWKPGFSMINRIVYPYNATVELPLYYDLDWIDIQLRAFSGVTAEALVFLGATPTAAETIWIEYSTFHNNDGTYTTIPDQDVDAFASLVAGRYILEFVAPALMQVVSGSGAAEFVSERTSADVARTIGRELMNQFYRHFGVTVDAPTKAASSAVSWNNSGRRGYVHH